MGNDGGSIPDRRDLVRTKQKAEQADRANQVRAMWFFCALSKACEKPIVSCPLGKLYNKDALLEFLLDRSSFGDGEEICGHIRTIKDVKTLKLTPNPTKAPHSPSSSSSAPDRAAFVCPLNFKEMNGVQPFVYLATCGCVFSQAGLKAVTGTAPSRSPTADDANEDGKDKPKEQSLDLCPQCGAKYDRSADVRMLNPPPEVEARMRAAMEARRALEPAKGKGKGKKRKAAASAAAAEDSGAEPPAKRKAASPLPTTNPSIAAASRAVAESLAKEEARRKAEMSDAVKSLYGPKDGSKKKETFMTMGTFTRVSASVGVVAENHALTSYLPVRVMRLGLQWCIGPVLVGAVYRCNAMMCIHTLSHVLLAIAPELCKRRWLCERSWWAPVLEHRPCSEVRSQRTETRTRSRALSTRRSPTTPAPRVGFTTR
ncbi:Rtf2 RING-finger-domain-containing protein [Trametes elegans]|nr:Rtf2 RING-finger-domain-containing protein [Trametes elegans]